MTTKKAKGKLRAAQAEARYFVMDKISTASIALTFALKPGRTDRERLGDAYNAAQIAAYGVCGIDRSGGKDREDQHLETMDKAARILGLPPEWLLGARAQVELRNLERRLATTGGTAVTEAKINDCLLWARTLYVAALDRVVSAEDWPI